MPVCTDFVGGQLVQVQSSIEDCTAYVLVTSNDYETMFASYTLDPVSIATAFSFGLGAIVTLYLTSYPVGAVKRMLLDDD